VEVCIIVYQIIIPNCDNIANNHNQLALKRQSIYVEYPTRVELPDGVSYVQKVECGCAFIYIISGKYSSMKGKFN
jgi:hypothetical protein